MASDVFFEDFITRITNVHWATTLGHVIAYIALWPNFFDPPNATSGSITENGSAWDSFGYLTGASGSGYTVVSNSRNVVFGAPKKGDKCFISVGNAGDISRGSISKGKLVWKSAGSVPGTLNSLSFAGDAFFISYSDKDGKTRLGASFDGEHFSFGINAFPGVEAASVGSSGIFHTPGPSDGAGGSVAYDPKRKLYVTTGGFNRSYFVNFTIDNEFVPVIDVGFADDNFMSAVSSSGVTWAPYFDKSEISHGTPTGVGGSSSAASVCFGKGVFVAAASVKSGVFVPGNVFSFTSAAYTAAVAVSSGESGWRTIPLPGAQQPAKAQDGSTVDCVVFVKTGEDPKTKQDKGYFVALGSDYVFVVDGHRAGFHRKAKFWTSSNSSSWSLVRTDDNATGALLSVAGKNLGNITPI